MFLGNDENMRLCLYMLPHVKHEIRPRLVRTYLKYKVLELTIIQDGSQKISNHSKFEPFTNRTTLDFRSPLYSYTVILKYTTGLNYGQAYLHGCTFVQWNIGS